MVPAPPPTPDIESAAVGPPWRSPAGRMMVGSGVRETGQARPVVFPVAGPVRYVNDFGACRDGCRRQHKGNDVIGDRLQPLLAMHDGVIDHLTINHPTAGFGVTIRDADGWEYAVFHVNNDTPGTDDGADDGSWRFAPGLAPGSPVTAGQLIAWMGDSGNSEGSVPHAHVEIHTPDGRAINPYWSLQQAQRAEDCSITEVADAPPAPPADRDPATLPGAWMTHDISGGRPGSGATVARMWIGPAGFTPIDSASLWVGDARYHDDCSQPQQAPPPVPSDLGPILATIRAVESGGDYMAQAKGSTASGAYGFLDSSWGGYMGYRRALDAPPPVQDAKAAELARLILDRNGGDVSTISVSWYIGHVPRGEEFDRVPSVGMNTVTPRQYQARWLKTYARILGTPGEWVAPAPSAPEVDTSRTCRTVVVDVGSPRRPELVLTEAQRFAADPAGRTVLAPDDPCDPQRIAPAMAPQAAMPRRLQGPR
jgi:murein DD-endopeptidase MepM/ murein hydrolase activator NlpD